MNTWKTFKEIEMDKDRTFYVLNTSFNQVLNINKIHPLKQEKVYSLIKNLVNMSFLKRIWIFGSSTNNSCNINSDIDVLVELENDSLSSDDDVVCMIQKNFAKSLGSNFDIVFLNDLDKTKQIYNNILKTRRLVYERAA
ncbi:MAG: nucleotidyltransferase domain-containing protein [Lachnospiraceae bacterium]|nr:nucleotidyltransferase domain-containing protein [Lachnospiraceae bacterium]